MIRADKYTEFMKDRQDRIAGVERRNEDKKIEMTEVKEGKSQSKLPANSPVNPG